MNFGPFGACWAARRDTRVTTSATRETGSSQARACRDATSRIWALQALLEQVRHVTSCLVSTGQDRIEHVQFGAIACTQNAKNVQLQGDPHSRTESPLDTKHSELKRKISSSPSSSSAQPLVQACNFHARLLQWSVQYD